MEPRRGRSRFAARGCAALRRRLDDADDADEDDAETLSRCCSCSRLGRKLEMSRRGRFEAPFRARCERMNVEGRGRSKAGTTALDGSVVERSGREGRSDGLGVNTFANLGFARFDAVPASPPEIEAASGGLAGGGGRNDRFSDRGYRSFFERRGAGDDRSMLAGGDVGRRRTRNLVIELDMRLRKNGQNNRPGGWHTFVRTSAVRGYVRVGQRISGRNMVRNFCTEERRCASVLL